MPLLPQYFLLFALGLECCPIENMQSSQAGVNSNPDKFENWLKIFEE
jgi:hypothetical protein